MAIDELGRRMDKSLGNLALETAEACRAVILQLTKLPVLARAHLADVTLTEQLVETLRAGKGAVGLGVPE
jgi:hypothetical protein